MTALGDRRAWLEHLNECTLCPVNPCDKGVELEAAVRETLAPGESMERVLWQPQIDQLSADDERTKTEREAYLAPEWRMEAR